MTNFRKVMILLVTIVGTVVLFLGIKVFSSNNDDSYIKVYKEYQEKGKSSQFNLDDVRKGFK
ncbi:hypothetical protein [Phosphitispora fastidiosa]|uniref:hypothetical protein n=1 Tax=Phosphitispora fastidiosa TaxID=2837202 RepID=UPI001E5A82D3|nr:hypothetical protein [Phosphitispora fastidiosa]MBU7006845.1 putative membrane protein [Phosphitispora fastidiosa]